MSFIVRSLPPPSPSKFRFLLSLTKKGNALASKHDFAIELQPRRERRRDGTRVNHVCTLSYRCHSPRITYLSFFGARSVGRRSAFDDRPRLEDARVLGPPRKSAAFLGNRRGVDVVVVVVVDDEINTAAIDVSEKRGSRGYTGRDRPGAVVSFHVPIFLSLSLSLATSLSLLLQDSPA